MADPMGRALLARDPNPAGGLLLCSPAVVATQRQNMLADPVSALTPLSSLGADLVQEGDIL